MRLFPRYPQALAYAALLVHVGRRTGGARPGQHRRPLVFDKRSKEYPSRIEATVAR